ncbi:DNA transfer protein [Escherichia coli]|uniref:DNA transfer protein n=1 Tax=Escherichia coli TaxID=562 RepID=A0A2X1N2I7_ECOLX|nr:DNA transfer protein [Escherichia coli]
MTDDINGAIGQNLGNDTLRKYQQANAVYADEAAKLKNTRLKNVLMKGDLTPEVVNNMLFSKNKSEIKTLYKLSWSCWQGANAQWHHWKSDGEIRRSP